MNRKGIEKGKKSSNDLVMIVMAAMVVMTAMTAFVPTAAAAGSVTDFTITAANATAGATDGYNITVNTTGYANTLTINITLPAGFSIANGSMTGGAEIARVDIYEDTGYYGNATFTANTTNPATEVRVVSKAGELTATKTVTMDYSAGASNSIDATVGSTSLTSTVVVPAASVSGANGSVNASITLPSGHNITNVSISIKGFVMNPATAATYTFSALVNSVEVTDTVTVTPVGFNIGSYDTSSNCKIEKAEALQAVTDYFMQQITKANALEVITAYFMQSDVC